MTCEGGVSLSSDAIPTVIPQVLTRLNRLDTAYTYEFRITAQGQTRDIKREDVEELGRTLLSAELAPALAAARFELAESERACQVTFTKRKVAVEEAKLEELMLARIHYRNSRIPDEVWVGFAFGDCRTKRARALERHYPDFRKIEGRPGAHHWAMFAYDIDEDGVPQHVQIVDSTGSDELEEAGRMALTAGRFHEEPRTGCRHYYWKYPGLTRAPERPDMASYGESPEAYDVDDRWETEPTLRFARSNERRGIEGWAVLRYDVAPWGVIGNVEVLDVQPTSEFGAHAASVLRSAKFKPREGGLSGCLDRVSFRLPDSLYEHEEE